MGSKLHFDLPEYHHAVNRVLASNILSEGPEAAALEREYGEWIGTHAIAVSSGTAALHAILLACDIGLGDEVIVPAITYTATAMVVLHVGAIPVFAGCDEFLTIDPAEVERLLTDRTAAVIAVDVDGVPADYDSLEPLCLEYGVSLIEDACPAHGALLGERQAGMFGTAAAFSFHQSKIIPAGEGGMVVTHHPEIAEQIRWIRICGEEPGYPHSRRQSTMVGHNWVMPELSAAMARASLLGAEARLNHGRVNAGMITRALLDHPALKPPPVRGLPSWHKYRARLRNGVTREWAEDYLERLAIPHISQEVLPLSLHPVFRWYNGGNAEIALQLMEDTVIIGDRQSPMWAVHDDDVRDWCGRLSHWGRYE